MSSDSPAAPAIDGSDLSFGIVAARFNQKYVDDLISHCLQTLDAAGVPAEQIETIRVPGANEIPYVLNMMSLTEDFDCLIGLGVVIAGETQHHEIIAHATAQAIQDIARESGVPVINGIIVVDNEEQAESRCSGALNRGREFAAAALAMADIHVRMNQDIESILDFSEEDFLEDEDADTDQDDDDLPFPGYFDSEPKNPWKS